MIDFHKEMAPVSADVIKTLNNLASPKWAIPFLGRRLSSACKEKFKDAETKGFRIELPWEGQVKYESHNAFDESTYVHELVVAVYSDGPASGRVKSIRAHHWEHWHTSSNWQDHSESCSCEKRSPTEKEIGLYKEMLESWTEGGTSEQILALTNELISIVRTNSGRIRINCCEHKENNPFASHQHKSQHKSYNTISISIFQEGEQEPKKIEINLDHLIEALDYSKIYAEAIHSPDDRKRLGICVDESWTLQYCLNFFNIFKTETLYQNLNVSLKAWLYKLYTACSSYRDFMDIQSEVWWRDAWWRLQEVVDSQHRIKENKGLLDTNCRNDIYPRNPVFFDDPFRDLVGKITMSTQRIRNQSYFDFPPFHRSYTEERIPSGEIIVNGIKWSVYRRRCRGSNDLELAIDLAKSHEVAVLNDGIAIIPYQIDGTVVTEIFASERCSKDWLKVVFDYPTAAFCSDSSSCKQSGLVEMSKCVGSDKAALRKYMEVLSIDDGAFRGWEKLEEVLFKRRHCYIVDYAKTPRRDIMSHKRMNI